MRRIIVLLLGAAPSGCDQLYDLTIDVVDTTGAPIANVAVQLDCPPAGLLRYEAHMALGTTDANGRVQHSEEIGEIPLRCWVHVPQVSSARFPVAALCAKRNSVRALCDSLTTTLRLAPAPTAPPAHS